MRAILLLGILIGSVLCGVEPVPLVEAARTDTPINKVWVERCLAWNRRTLVDSYRAVGLRDPSWDADAETLLGEWAQRFATEKGKIGKDQLVALATRLVDELKCTDPLVLYCAGKSFTEAKNPRAEALYRQADEGLIATEYPHFRKAFAVQQNIELALALDAPDLERVRVDLKRLDDFLELAWSDGEYQDVERQLAEHFRISFRHPVIGPEWSELHQALAERHHETWMGQFLLGWNAGDRAWKASDWKTKDPNFEKQFAIAENHLTKAWTMAPEQPVIASVMISVAGTANTADSMRTWFDRAVAAEFDHPEAYYNYLWQLSPRWGGSPEAMLAFGRECGATKRYDTAIPFKIVETMRDVGSEAIHMKRPQVIDRMFADQDLWKDVKAHLDHITTDPSFKGGANWFKSQQVALCWRFGEKDRAIAVARDLGPKLNIYALRHFGINPETIQTAVAQAQTEDADF